jgi:hypothetical protein
MKNSAKALIVSLILTATGFAGTAPQQTTWSVTTANASHHGNQVVMLQATSQSDSETAKQAKLDVICKNGKLAAIALEPAAALRKGAISYTGTLPTTRIALIVNDRANEADTWAVTDGGRTLTPYSETGQSQLNIRWIEQILRADRLTFAVETTESATPPTFATTQLSEALSSVGCSY